MIISPLYQGTNFPRRFIQARSSDHLSFFIPRSPQIAPLSEAYRLQNTHLSNSENHQQPRTVHAHIATFRSPRGLPLSRLRDGNATLCSSPEPPRFARYSARSPEPLGLGLTPDRNRTTPAAYRCRLQTAPWPRPLTNP